MWKFITGAVIAVLSPATCLAIDLTPTEMRWLKGAWPVVTFAKEAKLPLDIIVQPQPTPGAAPLALAFVEGRCKLVLSMRGNAEAQATLDRIEPTLLDETLELMAAHELGHCRRYLDGAWYGLPAGFHASEPTDLNPELRAAYVDMKAIRREEGYGDLVGLAWIKQRHPTKYAKLHAWLLAERSKDLVPGSHHDTLIWLKLAEQSTALTHPSIFTSSSALWTKGLATEE